MFPLIVEAKSFDEILGTINRTVLNPLIQFAFIVAFVVFIWGVAEFIRGANSPDKRKDGQTHMIWGIIGLCIMLGVYGIITLLANSIGTKAILNNKEQTITPPKIQELKIN